MAKRRRRKTASAPPRRRSRRRRSPMSEPGTRRRRRTTGTRRRRRRGGLSEIFTHAGFKESGLGNLKALGGGGIAYGIDYMGMKDASPLMRGLVQVGAAFVLDAGLGMKDVARGMSGAYGYTLLNDLTGGLSEDMDDTDYADEDALCEYPDALDENDNPMFLAEDGELYYLDEFELAEDGTMYLAESGIARMYPDYVQNP